MVVARRARSARDGDAHWLRRWWSAFRARLGAASPRPEYGEVGASGTGHTGGRIWGVEHNADLIGQRWVRLAEQMLREDPKIRSSWRALKNTLLSATWFFRPGRPGDARSQALCDYANEAFGLAGKPRRMSLSWEEQLSYLLEFVPVGFRYAEPVYYADSGRVWLHSLADREPRAHQLWQMTEDGAELECVVQAYLYQTGRKNSRAIIPADKLLLLTLDRTGSNFEGCGLLRSCVHWSKIKNLTSDLLGIGMERWAIPTPLIEVNRAELEGAGYTGGPNGTASTAIQRAQNEIAAYLVQEQGWLSEVPGIKFSTFGDGVMSAEGPLAVIREADEQIATAFLVAFLTQGVSDTGSYASSRVAEHFFRRAAVNINDLIAAAINGPARPGGGIMHRLIQWNFGVNTAVELLPQLDHDGLDVDHLSDSFGALGQLAAADLVRTDGAIRNEIRRRLRVPAEGPDAERVIPVGSTDGGGASGGRPEVTE